jgi:predicted DNA-binding transcriptional regulator YafY
LPEYKQIERIIRILQRLALYKRVTIKDLYNYFEGRIPRRTLQRDMYELSCADIPLVTQKGQGREFIWSIDDYFLKFIPVPLANNELNAALFLEKFIGIFEGTSIAQQAQGLLEKAKQLAPEKVVYSSEDDCFPDMFGITRIGYIDYSGHKKIIDRFVEAARLRKTCKVSYNTPGADKPNCFDVEPYLLLLHKGAMYGVVYLPYYSNYIYLHIHRMADIDILDTVFKRNPGFSIEKLREGKIGIFGQEKDRPVKVVLKFDPVVADTIACRMWHNTQKCTMLRSGHLKLEMNIIVSDELLGWIFSWQDYVQVLKPKSLIEEINLKLSKIKEKYTD